MATEFLHVKTPAQLRAALEGIPRPATRRLPLDDCLGCVLMQDVVAGEDLPDGDRSTMDGFAVRAQDTFGASASLPLPLELVGAVCMGQRSELTLQQGQAVQIPTGGYLPRGADAVVMVEQTNVAATSLVEVFRPVTQWENVLRRAEDIALGQTVVTAGRRLLPWDLGLLAALGFTHLEVGAAVRAVVFSTGDEVVDIDKQPGPGQIRDANAHAIAALLSQAGCQVELMGIVPDQVQPLRQAIEKGLCDADLVVLSGGSSVGDRDLMPAVVASLDGAEILLHGVAMRPGKPTLLARVGDKTVFGLPGHPVSAIVVAHVFLVPFVHYLSGEKLREGPLGRGVEAELVTSIHSARGRQEFVRVQISQSETGLLATPLFGKSAMLSSLVRAHGFVVVPMESEGIARGDRVRVVLLENRSSWKTSEVSHG